MGIIKAKIGDIVEVASHTAGESIVTDKGIFTIENPRPVRYISEIKQENGVTYTEDETGFKRVTSLFVDDQSFNALY